LGAGDHNEPDQGEDRQGQERDIEQEQPVVRSSEQEEHGVVEQVADCAEPERKSEDLSAPDKDHAGD
jgi:hypothetical protein